MDWTTILSVIVGLLAAVGLPLAFRRRKKGGPLRREELCQHLQEIGVKASLAEKGREEERIGTSRASGQKSEGLIEVEGQKIDFINVISVASQYGTHYFIDYLVKAPGITENRVLKKTYLVKKRSSPFWGKVMSVEWKGDKSLAQSLSFDYGLEDKLLRCEAKDLEAGIQIFPEPKHGYARIRTAYTLPSADTFSAIDTIAKHVKLW